MSDMLAASPVTVVLAISAVSVRWLYRLRRLYRLRWLYRLPRLGSAALAVSVASALATALALRLPRIRLWVGRRVGGMLGCRRCGMLGGRCAYGCGGRLRCRCCTGLSCGCGGRCNGGRLGGWGGGSCDGCGSGRIGCRYSGRLGGRGWSGSFFRAGHPGAMVTFARVTRETGPIASIGIEVRVGRRAYFLAVLGDLSESPVALPAAAPYQRGMLGSRR